jgi:hypothetical protein
MAHLGGVMDEPALVLAILVASGPPCSPPAPNRADPRSSSADAALVRRLGLPVYNPRQFPLHPYNSAEEKP